MKMKNLLLICLAISLVAAPACTRRTVIVKSSSKPLPPGQAKKITGSKSAKPYAPGQQKKNN
jgi:hypothetical protein